MKKSELQEIAEKLGDEYGSGRHYEIIKAEKTGLLEDEVDGWRLEIREIKREGAKNASNK